MGNKSSFKDLYSIIALVISGAICVGLIFLLYDKYQNTFGFEENLKKLTSIFIGISGVLAAILMVFLATSAMNQKSHKAKIIGKISKTTQKMHNFRTIAELLFNSNIWLSGLKEYMEKDFADLSYFDVKEFYKGKSKLAIEFLQETHHYGETENVYLEMKSLLMTSPEEKHIPETINYPIFYNYRIIEKWVENKSGSGLWYVFGYKFGNYKESLNLEAVFERHQEKILTLANTIDNEVFENSSFNEVFFSKLWEYMTKDVIPKLYQFQVHIKRKTPRLIYYLYVVFFLLIVFGVLFPITYLMLSFSALAIIIGYSIVISTIFYIALTFHVFLSKEVNS
ncbi:hypothetical protein [Aequorivita lipolytica]|uniref:Uncharacterized protein n=1 Tax=Aequorivita lipolytica TaxID=153267 RepID=A0A5C6YQQ7_9FLAO|nr:hypothetical protein [Aequorivita lipolytica]TXD69675.1 hypothetical protein ESV24_07530 [Aequorivita lipolytica]SRX51169.1 hypothetical protein AEQU2_01649 [Aequorivita lipolytica]